MTVHATTRAVFAALLIPGLSFSLLFAQDPGSSTDPSARLFDTRVTSSVPLSGNTVSTAAGWNRLPEDDTDHRFAGDLVISNGRLSVVFRQWGPGGEVYSRGLNGLEPRAVLRPAGIGPDTRIESLAIVENSAGQVAVDAKFRAAGGAQAAFGASLSAGQTFVKTDARNGLEALAVEAPSRFTILPDFFADDIVVDATEIPIDEAQLPCENFMLNLVGQSDAIVMTVSNDRRQDVRIQLSGSGVDRKIRQSEIAYGTDGKIWIAVLEGSNIWHLRDVTGDDAGRVVGLDWTMPFPAQWRVDFRRDDRLTGSWEMVTERSDGHFDKHGWFGETKSIPPTRKRWTTVLGRFKYPCWADTQGRGFFEPFALHISFQGPAVIYPINRVKNTPLDQFTVVDLVRATLGVGPCQYILDVEGQGQSNVGRATCSTRDLLNRIYADGRQKEETEQIEQALDDVLAFVKHIRGRIEEYVAFGHELLKYLDEQERNHPELDQFIAEMKTTTRAIDEYYRKRREEIKTPQYVAVLTDKFRRELLVYDGDDALGKCKQITAAFVNVGGNQDELVGECRMAVKVIRQRSGLAMAIDPRTADIAREIRRRTQEILRNPASYEAPRH